jgi:hypothetical protein
VQTKTTYWIDPEDNPLVINDGDSVLIQVKGPRPRSRSGARCLPCAGIVRCSPEGDGQSRAGNESCTTAHVK